MESKEGSRPGDSDVIHLPMAGAMAQIAVRSSKTA